jgi:ceramide glucosyltransferase
MPKLLDLSSCLGCVFEVAAILGCLQLLLAALLVRRYARRPKARPSCCTFPPVSILVPLHGTEPGLFARLAAFCTQDYAGPVQLVLGTRTHNDVIEIVRRLRLAFPAVPIAYVFDRREHGSSRKFSNLINMMPLVRHDHLVFADSDVQVGANYLADLMAELQQPGVEAVSCLYRARAEGGIWSRLAAVSINADFLPQVIVALTCRLAQPCLGPTIAIRRQMLNRIGGLANFVNFLGADYLIGKAVRSCGGEVAFASFTIECACSESTGAELFARQLRAARTIKTIKPFSHAGTVVTHPLPLALLAALLDSPSGFLLAAVAVSCRMLLYFSVERAFHPRGQRYFLIPLQDLFSFAVFVASFFGRTVIWRGFKYRITPSLRMIQVNVETASRHKKWANNSD